MNDKKEYKNQFKYILGNSMPCNRCQTFLHLHNIKKIKFTNIINGENVLCEMRKI